VAAAGSGSGAGQGGRGGGWSLHPAAPADFRVAVGQQGTGWRAAPSIRGHAKTVSAVPTAKQRRSVERPAARAIRLARRRLPSAGALLYHAPGERAEHPDERTRRLLRRRDHGSLQSPQRERGARPYYALTRGGPDRRGVGPVSGPSALHLSGQRGGDPRAGRCGDSWRGCRSQPSRSIPPAWRSTSGPSRAHSADRAKPAGEGVPRRPNPGEVG